MMAGSTVMEPPDVVAGWQALQSGDWEQARARFTASLAEEETARAYEGLGWAGYFLDDDPGTFHARERAYQLYREEGEGTAAARVAAWLAADHLEFRGEAAVANGWLQRARRLLDGQEPGPDHGWLAIHEASTCLLEDPEGAGRLGAEAAELGRRFDVPELEMVGLATEGQSLVLRGDIVNGMRCLDEASALAFGGDGQMIVCVAWACCYLISACEQVRDYDRAGQWCVQMTTYCERFGIGVLLGQCRAKYAGVLLWQGRWEEAERQLLSAERELASARPALVGEALVRLGDLRRHQGRTEEATALYTRCDGNLRALLGRAALALDEGANERAHDLLERFLRRLPPHDPERAGGLELLVHATSGLGLHEQAKAALEDLRRLSTQIGTAPLRASVHQAEATTRLADGDPDAARRRLEDAIDTLVAEGAPFEVARTRRRLAEILAALGRSAEARGELTAALATQRELGAHAEIERLDRALARLDAADPTATSPLGVLTPREREVLGLVATGLTNHQIAERLVLSEHTVHRHVGNILRKLALRSRTAAAALAVQHGLV